MEVKKTNIKAIKPAMEEVLGERSMRDSEMTRRSGRGEHGFLLEGRLVRMLRLIAWSFNIRPVHAYESD